MQLDLGAAVVPEARSLAALERAVQACTACPLYRDATQAVGGEGQASARIVLVGEAPGDQEDQEGRPDVADMGQR